MNKQPALINVLPTPTLEYPGRPSVSQKQNYALQAEFFLIKALDRAAWSYRKEYSKLTAVMDHIQSSIATEGLATAEGLDQLREFVFEDAFNREFIQTVHLNFITMFAEWNIAWREFISNISLGLTMSYIDKLEVNEGLNAVPDELRVRRYDSSVMADWLRANNWAVIVIMLKMWGTLPDEQ